jgi:cyclophilin family peptidyl-prolyl cis-trans isomerase
MARGDTPDSADAEFFIDLSDNADLNHQQSDTGNATGYTVFGHVSSGMDTVDKIAGVKLGDNGPFPGAAPVDPVVIRKVTVQP